MLSINFKHLVATGEDTISNSNSHHKNLSHFWQRFFSVNFFFALLFYLQNEWDSYRFGFSIIALQIYKEILKNNIKGYNFEKIEKKILSDNGLRNNMP